MLHIKFTAHLPVTEILQHSVELGLFWSYIKIALYIYKYIYIYIYNLLVIIKQAITCSDLTRFLDNELNDILKITETRCEIHQTRRLILQIYYDSML